MTDTLTHVIARGTHGEQYTLCSVDAANMFKDLTHVDEGIDVTCSACQHRSAALLHWWSKQNHPTQLPELDMPPVNEIEPLDAPDTPDEWKPPSLSWRERLENAALSLCFGGGFVMLLVMVYASINYCPS